MEKISVHVKQEHITVSQLMCLAVVNTDVEERDQTHTQRVLLLH